MVSSNESANPRTKRARSHPDSDDRDQGNRYPDPSCFLYGERRKQSNRTDDTRVETSIPMRDAERHDLSAARETRSDVRNDRSAELLFEASEHVTDNLVVRRLCGCRGQGLSCFVQKTQLLINPRQEDEVHRVTTELRSESAASARRGNRQRHKRPARAGRGRRIA